MMKLYLFLRLNNFENCRLIGSILHLPDCDVKFTNQSVASIVIVIKALHFDISVQVAVAESSDRNRKLFPKRIDVVVDVLRSMDHSEFSSLV